MLAYPKQSNSEISRVRHLCCKYFLVKHTPWQDIINKVGGGPITYLYLGNMYGTLKDNHELAMVRYIEQFEYFYHTVDIPQL